MTEDIDKIKIVESDLDNICDECKSEDSSLTENRILTGFKPDTY